jgi:hypothetical protein
MWKQTIPLTTMHSVINYPFNCFTRKLSFIEGTQIF